VRHAPAKRSALEIIQQARFSAFVHPIPLRSGRGDTHDLGGEDVEGSKRSRWGTSWCRPKRGRPWSGSIYLRRARLGEPEGACAPV